MAQNKEMVKYGVDTNAHIPKGIKVGEEAPKIVAVSLNGDTINSNEILKEKNIVLIFYRGKWCPVCNRYLSNLNDSLSYITNKNTVVLVVGPETFENSEKIIDKSAANFTLVPDTSLQILTDYDVLFHVTSFYQNKVRAGRLTDIAKNNNQKEAVLPVPATYIIGKGGKIIYRQFDFNYTKRATVKEIIEHLE